MPTRITALRALDVRFPTSDESHGSDAMNPDPDYSAAYVILRTDLPAAPAGHGLTFNTVGAVARIPEMMELNIGHFLVGEAIFVGLGPAIRRMRGVMDEARTGRSS